MNRNLSILLLLCVAMLIPSVASAQFFAKQKVIVWEVTDRNNGVQVADGTKQEIRTSIVNALSGSRNYEAFESNFDDVARRIKAQGGAGMSRGNIARVARELYKVNYVIFTTIQIIERSNSYEGFSVHISCDLFSTETQKSERIAYEDMRSDLSLIPGVCAKLLGKLLGEQIAIQSTQPTVRQSAPNQYPQSHSPVARGGVEVVFGYLKVFPNELGTFPSAPTTIIDQINKQGMHDYDTWRLPTDEELALLRANGLIGSGKYMREGYSESGIVVLVTDATETYSAKQARLAEEKRIKYGGLGDNGVYKVGYYYNRNGKQGVVFEVSADGWSGKIISLQETQTTWDSAKQWCANLGQGWRLPTRAELQTISCIKDNKEFQEGLSTSGAKPVNFSFYWTGEELGSDRAWYVLMRDGYANDYRKSGNCYVRAVSAF